MLSVWGRKNSFNVQKVMWFIGELGLQYHLIPFGGQFGDCDTEEFAVINPTRQPHSHSKRNKTQGAYAACKCVKNTSLGER
ncbi:hypothetical protein [Serratia sp. N21D137]|uniref:hypothetical protein n=1 Tax=Serratia sp. N21D137 TaxID=3397495 RepID=UPI0039DF7885